MVDPDALPAQGAFEPHVEAREVHPEKDIGSEREDFAPGLAEVPQDGGQVADYLGKPHEVQFAEVPRHRGPCTLHLLAAPPAHLEVRHAGLERPDEGAAVEVAAGFAG